MSTDAVLQLSCENEHEGLLPDCTVGVRMRAKTKFIQVECIGSMHGSMQATYDCVTRQAASIGQQVRWLQVHAWHDRSYIAWTPLLAHGLTVKLSPCPCSHSSLAGWNSCMSVWAFQMQFATCSGSPQDDSASY